MLRFIALSSIIAKHALPVILSTILLILQGLHVCVAGVAEPGAQKDNTVTLAIGENWEPYYSETLPNGGVVTEIVRRAFERSGYQIEIKWLPWARALSLAKSGSYDGLIGAWYTEERAQYFSYSRPFLSTEIVVIKRKGESFAYNKRSDLAAYKVGVALDSAPHEMLKKEMEHNLEVGISAYSNIQKLIAKRFDLLVDERLNISYILSNHFPEWINAIEVLYPPLQINNLHLVITKENPDYQKLTDVFNQGLKEIKNDGTFQLILKEYGFSSGL